MQFGLGNVPGMMRIRKAHPAKERFVRLLSQPGYGPIRNPLSVIVLKGDVHRPDLRCSSLTFARRILTTICNHGIKRFFTLRELIHVKIKVRVALKKMVGQFHVIEPSMRSRVAGRGHSVFKELLGRAEPRFKVSLTQQRGAITMFLEMMSNRRLILR